METLFCRRSNDLRKHVPAKLRVIRSPELVEFAEASARRWLPAEVVVMDVARHKGTWKIIEFNCSTGGDFISPMLKLSSLLSRIFKLNDAEY